MQLIGLTGLAQSGKSTAAGFLEGVGFARLRFADPIKKALAAILASAGLEEETIRRHLDGDLKEVPLAALQGKTARHAMQTLGTEWGQGLIGKSLWIDITMAKARKLLGQGIPVVIDDVRFLAEARAVEKHGGLLAAVIRPGQTRKSNHSSEDGGDFYRVTLTNDGGKDRLEAQVLALVQRRKEKMN